MHFCVCRDTEFLFGPLIVLCWKYFIVLFSITSRKCAIESLYYFPCNFSLLMCLYFSTILILHPLPHSNLSSQPLMGYHLRGWSMQLAGV